MNDKNEWTATVRKIMTENASVMAALALSEARDKFLNVLKGEMRWQMFLNNRKWHARRSVMNRATRLTDTLSAQVS